LNVASLDNLTRSSVAIPAPFSGRSGAKRHEQNIKYHR
jgi:hypothetical protein